MPYFDFDVQRNITVTIGQTAFLHCRVERLGDKDVSDAVLLQSILIIRFDLHYYYGKSIESLLIYATIY